MDVIKRQRIGLLVVSSHGVTGWHPLAFGSTAEKLVTLAGIPVLLIIGHNGGVGEENPGHATVGMLTEPVLHGMNIMYEKVGRLEEIRPAILDSQTLARSSRRPVAIVLNKEALR